MDEKDYELLHALDETRNITHAADKLYMTQSALSKRIKALEQELGVEIVLRSRQGIRFTPAGEQVLLHSAAAASISSMALVSFFIVSPRYGKRRYNSKRGVCNKYTRLRLFISDYSEKSESISSDRVAIAASSSAPSAMMVIAVPLTIPRERTPRRLFALTLLSSFSIQIELL